MFHSPQFTLSLSIGPTNKERVEAFEMYHRAFNATKLSESTPRMAATSILRWKSTGWHSPSAGQHALGPALKIPVLRGTL